MDTKRKQELKGIITEAWMTTPLDGEFDMESLADEIGEWLDSWQVKESDEQD